MRDQGSNILAPFLQAGQAQADHLEPAIQVLAETPRGKFRLEVSVRRRNHPHIDCHILQPANRPHLPFLQCAQQLDLMCRRHVADLVEQGLGTKRLGEIAEYTVLDRGYRVGNSAVRGQHDDSGKAGFSARIASNRAMPPICRSVTTTCGRDNASRAIAPSPLSTPMTR